MTVPTYSAPNHDLSASFALAYTANNTTVFGEYTAGPVAYTVGIPRAVYVGSSGSVVVVMAGEEGDVGTYATVTFSNVSAGTILPIRVKQILTSSTASGFVLLW